MTLHRIQAALAENGVSLWRIQETTEETAELFFIRKKLDTRRSKEIRTYTVTIFRDFEKDGARKRGFTETKLNASMSDRDIDRAIHDAYFAAQFAGNPTYVMPDPVRCSQTQESSESEAKRALAEKPLAECAGIMTRALFAADTRGDAWLNSAELFIIRKQEKILTSWGTDVSFAQNQVKGEFIVQCGQPEDVELFDSFAYDALQADALTARVTDALTFVRDRAAAQPVLKSGEYDIILSGDAVGSVLSYYTSRASATMIYSKYSSWQLGTDVQGDSVAGEKLNLSLTATQPYSEEGIPMTDLPLLREGRLMTIHGGNRFCRYLGVRPTGNYEKISCTNAGIPFEQLKKKPYLWVVTFSSFHMDSLTGHFGGEIRLAYLFDGKKTVSVTGGSVNGSILACQSQLQCSAKRYVSAGYDGPYAMRFPSVPVAGN